MNRPALFLITFFLLALTPARLSAAWPQEPPPCTTARPASPGGPGWTVCTSITFNPALGTTSIAVSWLSRSTETGSVNVLDVGSYSDSRGENYSGMTHFVELRDLEPNTTYLFDIVSGGSLYDNDRQHWSIQTGPALPPDPRGSIFGRIQNPDGTPAGEALVYVTLHRSNDLATSALLSSIVTPDQAGFFNLQLGNARTALNGGRFSFDSTQDRITVTAAGGAGFAFTTVLIADALPPQPNPPNVTLMLGAGQVVAATATPTPTLPTSTPTAVTPTWTATLIPATPTVAETPTVARRLTRLAPTAPSPAASETSPFETTPAVSPADATRLAEASAEVTEGALSAPTIFRAPLKQTPAAPTSALFGGLEIGNMLTLFAVSAFGIAVILGAAALILWKR